MEQRLKQRLVGASVLVALVVIFVPELLEEDASREPRARTEAVADGSTQEADFTSRIVPLDEAGAGDASDGAQESLPVSPQGVVGVAEPTDLDVASGGADSESGDGQAAGAPTDASPSDATATDAFPTEPPPLDSGEDGSPLQASGPGKPVPRPKPAAVAASTDPLATPGVPMPLPKTLPEAAPEDAGAGLSAWAIQLGSFSQAENAIGLRDRLRQQGYTAFVQSAASDEGTVTRVFVGPEIRRDRAEAARQRLQSELDLNAIVVPFPGG